MTGPKMTRQVRRQMERRAGKPPVPQEIDRTSMFRGGGGTKGVPFGRCILKDMKMRAGKPALLTLFHPTRGNLHVKPATHALLDVFYPAMPEKMRWSMLGLA